MPVSPTLIPQGTATSNPPPETRRYLFAGTQHVPGAPDLMVGQGPDGSTGHHPYNAVDYIPLLRAALFNLDRWVTDGVEPPASQHPRLDDGTAVSQVDYLQRMPTIPGRNRPYADRLWRVREVDVGPSAARGIASYPVREGREYPHLVPASDADGNDLAGIRLPDLTVPVGTHTGWNLRHPDTGAPEQLISMQGSSHWFPATSRPARRSWRPSFVNRGALHEPRGLRRAGKVCCHQVGMPTGICCLRTSTWWSSPAWSDTTAPSPSSDASDTEVAKI